MPRQRIFFGPTPVRSTPVRFVPAGLLIVLAAVLSGCNTVEGAGKDIEAAGDEVQDAAD